MNSFSGDFIWYVTWPEFFFLNISDFMKIRSKLLSMPKSSFLSHSVYGKIQLPVSLGGDMLPFNKIWKKAIFSSFFSCWTFNWYISIIFQGLSIDMSHDQRQILRQKAFKAVIFCILEGSRRSSQKLNPKSLDPFSIPFDKKK